MGNVVSRTPAHFRVAHSGVDSEGKVPAVTRIATECRVSVAAASRKGV
jgi:hypothetical protein